VRSNPLTSALADLIHYGGVAPVWCDGHEILRRIFVTVRDWQWQEIAPREWDHKVDEASRTVSMSARHISDHVDFEWRGTLHIASDARELSFAFSGRALRDMEVCRLGLVVLHPLESMLGSRLSAQGSQAQHHLHVARAIAPQPIVNGIPAAMTEPFSLLRIERSDFGVLELRFEGDLFELEDQRNWGDASFKTYCTPLRLGFPRTVKAGTSIAQSVQLRFEPANARTSLGTSRAQESEHKARPGWSVFPEIGREWHSSSAGAKSHEQTHHWRHIQFRVTEGEGNLAALRSLLESDSLPRLEIAFEAQGERGPLNEALALLSRHRDRVVRILLYGVGSLAPLAAALERLRQALNSSAALTDVPILAATRGYFVEFNRAVPLNVPISGIAFPLTATVHSDDVDTIADNVATIRDIADTARDLMQLPELAVAPFALYHPPSEPPRNFPPHLICPWLTATLIHAALARVTSVTLGEDVLAQSKGLHGSDDLQISKLGIRPDTRGKSTRAFRPAHPLRQESRFTWLRSDVDRGGRPGPEVNIWSNV
jgi:D-apionolactonase